MSLAGAVERAWRWAPRPVRRGLLFATNAKFLVGTVGVVLDERGHVLVLEHRFRVPHRWGLPGGHLEHGELPHQGLEREILEETGLVVRARPLVLDLEQNVEGRYFSMTLVAEVIGGRFRLSGEIADGAFFPPEALPAGMDPYQGEVVARWVRAGRPTDDAADRRILGWRTTGGGHAT